MERRLLSRSFVFSALLVAVILTWGMGLSSTFAAPPGKPEISKLNIGLPVPVLSFLPVYVAEEKGFFKEEGLTEVKILAFKGDADVIQGLTAGTLDINVASLTGVVVSINAGQKFKAFWGGYNMAYMDWYALPKYKTVADTKGGRWGITRYGALTDFLTRYLLRSVGLNPEKDVTILQVGGGEYGIPAMEAGQLDVCTLSPVHSYVASEKGFRLIANQRQIAPDWPTHVIYAKEDFIAKNPNTIKAVLRAHSNAMEWMKANPDEAAKIGNKVIKAKVEHCRRALDELRDDFQPDGRLPQKGMKIFWEIAIQAGDVKEAWPDSKWLDPTLMQTQSQWRK